MAMLAESKRKEKWCLNPRGKAWSEDNTKFGQRLLEKMGWNAGQGLGINNQGLTDIIKVKKKDDSKGLGFKDNGEEWLKTTSDYNELLEQLGSSLEEERKDGTDLASSLEDRSKKSKARVHYHKFTRGKDLSRYSEKDLASILGPDVVKLKTVDASSSDYASNQVNKGSSAEYFNQKKKPTQRDDCVQAESDNLNLSINNTGADTRVIDQKSKKKKSSEDVYTPILASELFTEEIKVEKKKKHKKKKAINYDGEKETEENGVLSSHIENAQKKKNKKKETENLSTVDSKEENSSITHEKNQTKDYNDVNYTVPNSFGEPMKKKKNKHIESLPQFEDNKNHTSNEIFEMSTDYSIGMKGSKRKKKNLLDEIQSQGLAEQTNSNASNHESHDNVETNNVTTKAITIINKEKHLLASEVRKNLNEGNPIDSEGGVIPRKKKKMHNDSFSFDPLNQEDQHYNEKLDKVKKNKTKMYISNNLELPEIEVLKSDRLKKKTTSEIENNCGSHLSEPTQEELIFKTKKKEKNKKNSESGSELHKEQSLVKIKQANSSGSGEFLEILGRKTRLRKIDLLNRPAEHVRYDTEDFMSFTSSGPNNTSQTYNPSKTINTNIRTNQKPPLRKVQVEPSQQDLDLPKSVIILEYRLLTKKLKELNLSAPEMKIIIKDKTLARATCRKLKQLQKSKEIKAVLPPEHVAEVEAAVKKYTEELKPKIDMIKTLAEIEKKTVLIAEELVDESNLQIKKEKEPLKILDPEKVKVVKQMSKQLKKLLEGKSTEETVKSADTDQVTPSRKRKAENLAELNSTSKKLKLNSEKNESETLDLAKKENVLLTNSLQKRIEERLKDLAEQMKMLKEGKKPVITPTLQPKPNVIKESFTKRVFSRQNFRSFARRRSQGAARGSFTQNRTEPSRHSFFPQNENSDSLGDEPDTFEHPGGRGGFGISLRGVRSAIPRGGWGILKSYGMASESAGGFINRGQLSRGSFVRGRTFRGRGRGELLRGRGRISQNNFDAKQYAEKCKRLNKVPEIAFKGVDLGVISGYAASQAVEPTMSSSKTVTDSTKTSCEFTEVVVRKEQVKNLSDS